MNKYLIIHPIIHPVPIPVTVHHTPTRHYYHYLGDSTAVRDSLSGIHTYKGPFDYPLIECITEWGLFVLLTTIVIFTIFWLLLGIKWFFFDDY